MTDYAERVAKVEAYYQGHIPIIHGLYAKEYLNALTEGNESIVAEYESFGTDENLRQLFMNKDTFVHAQLFGFTSVNLDENGWLKQEDFLDTETIQLSTTSRNFVTIGRGLNGKWTHGVWLSTKTSGFCSGLSVFGKISLSKHECILGVLEFALSWLGEAPKDKEAAKASATARRIYEEMTGKRPVQLSLF